MQFPKALSCWLAFSIFMLKEIEFRFEGKLLTQPDVTLLINLTVYVFLGIVMC